MRVRYQLFHELEADAANSVLPVYGYFCPCVTTTVRRLPDGFRAQTSAVCCVPQARPTGVTFAVQVSPYC